MTEYCSDFNPSGIRSGDGVQVPGVSCAINWELINEGVNSLSLLLKQLFRAVPRSSIPAPPFLFEGDASLAKANLPFVAQGINSDLYRFVEARTSGATLSTHVGGGGGKR